MESTQHPSTRLETTLDDKYTLREGWAFMSGTQALVRLPMQQRMRDEAAGKNTAGFISGYRGSPLGRYDIELWRVEKLLKQHHIHFQPGVNEDLAATAAWGAQYVGVFPGARYDGVFGIWYGKGPGVDRSGDALRHANLAGTSPWGGVVALAGDDHAAKSSTAAAQSDQDFIAVGIPLLYPASVQEILDYGLHGIAMSRYSGCWTGLKVVTDVVESSGTVQVAPEHPRIVLPPPSATVPGGLAIRRDDTALAQEDRLYNHKLHAVMAYARANALDRIVIDTPTPRLGIVAPGKSYADVRQAMLELGLDEASAAARGIRLLKIAMVWPLDPEIVTRFAQGLDTILVVEEKRPVVEDQLKAILYDAALARRPRVLGKFDAASMWSPNRGAPVLPVNAELSPPLIAAQVARLLGLGCDALLAASAIEARPGPIRMPNFCSGCPHNTSTQVPPGSRALAGIGCHAIARLQRPEHTATICHMGAEGAMWVGQAPFTDERHVFANIGDGTYFHSGFLAIRQAVAAKVSITYKLLVNGFVSMTGGQPIDGELGVPQMATELLAEGVARVVVVTDEPEKYRHVQLPAGVAVRHRRHLEAVQEELREVRGTSVLVYDQMCATERRRQRKRGKLADPPKRIFINAAVCEGCGDCSAKSNCMSVEPLETELGRKRRINQSSCNKDYSCVEGFCPSFVSVIGASPLRGAARAQRSDGAVIPEPELPALGSTSYGVLVTGIGGTGVVTIGSILGVAAHIDGKAASVLDVTGLAQKYGAVMSHVRIAGDPALLQSTRLAAREANLVVGCDLVVTAGSETLSRMDARRTCAVVNTELTPTSDFTRNPDWRLDEAELRERVRSAASTADCVAVTRVATALMGDAIAVNMFMVGYAWQKGWLPVSRAAVERAIELNDVAVAFNKDCFAWGRRYAHDPAEVETLLQSAQVLALPAAPSQRLEDLVAHRATYLTAYQDEAYAARYRAFVERVERREREVGGDGRLAIAVARYYFKLLAHKDEFEVARLYSAPEFRGELARTFDGDYRLQFHLGAGPFARRDRVTGQPLKTEVGAWVLVAFRVLASLRKLRGTWLDPFRRSPDRKLAAQLLAEYERDVDALLRDLDGPRQTLAVELASWPERVRGYAHVRAESAEKTRAEKTELWRKWDTGGAQRGAAIPARSA